MMRSQAGYNEVAIRIQKCLLAFVIVTVGYQKSLDTSVIAITLQAHSRAIFLVSIRMRTG